MRWDEIRELIGASSGFINASMPYNALQSASKNEKGSEGGDPVSHADRVIA